MIDTGCRSQGSSFRYSQLPRWLIFVSLSALLFASGCANRRTTTQPPSPPPSASAAPPPAERQPAVPGEYVEQGVASWYGEPFNGHRTSNGEIYDMHGYTAAHRTLPFGAVVRVTNLDNGQQTQVRVNDRGPFVNNRVIDLSQSAAKAIGMIGPGTAHVKLEVIAGPNPFVGNFGVQVGAFLVQQNANKLKDRLAAGYSPVVVLTYDSPNGVFYRVRAGRFPTEAGASQLAQQLRKSGQPSTFVVRLDN